MEASMAAQGDAGQQGDGEAQQQQGPDVSALVEQFGSMQQGQEEMRTILTGLQEHLAPAQEEQGLPELDLSAFDPESPSFDPNELAQRLTGFVDQQAQAQAQQLVQQHIAPLQQQVGNLERQHQAAALISEFPEMGEGDTIQQVTQLSGQVAESIGQPALADNLMFVRLVYMAGRAAEAAQQENAEGPQAAQLEGGGGAGPGAGGQPGVMTAKSIVEGGGRGSSVLPF